MSQLNQLFNGIVVQDTNYMPSKMTDVNHLMSIYQEDPSKFDPNFVNMFTQTALLDDSFLVDVENAPVFTPTTSNDSYTYKIPKFKQAPKIVENLANTQQRPGIDRQPFKLIFDIKEFVINDTITYDYMGGQQFKVVAEPRIAPGGWEYTLQLATNNAADYARQDILRVGTEYAKISNIIGEFDTKFSSFTMDGSIELMDRMGAAFGIEHQVTGWAMVQAESASKDPDITGIYATRDSLGNTLRDSRGNPTVRGLGWIPKVELGMLMQHKLDKSRRMMWDQESITMDGEGNNMVYNSPGLYQQMHKGHVARFNKGELTMKFFREIFGDLFYRRVPMEKRRVELSTNEAGYILFSHLVGIEVKQGLPSIIIDATSVGLITGTGLDMKYAAGFSGIKTLETGEIVLKHYQVLDTPTGTTAQLSNKKSDPIFIVTDISNGATSNIRQIKLKGWQQMAWFYIKGRTVSSAYGSLGNFKFQSSSRNPWDEMITEERCAVKLIDPTRSVLIKQYPNYYRSF